jgi:hypothetical protein
MGTPEVVHTWSGSSSSIFKKAKSQGILCILERSSSHIRKQYSIFGMRDKAAATVDEYHVASVYRVCYGDGRMRYGISMNADLFRRFGWIGFPVVTPAIAVINGLYWRFIFCIHYKKMFCSVQS